MNGEGMENTLYPCLSIPVQPCSCNCLVYLIALSMLKHVSISFAAGLSMLNGCKPWKKNAQGWEHEGKWMCCEFHGKQNETDSQVEILPYLATSQIKQTHWNTTLPAITQSYHNNTSTPGKLIVVHWFPHSFPWILSPQSPNLFASLSLNIKVAKYTVWPSRWLAIVAHLALSPFIFYMWHYPHFLIFIFNSSWVTLP